MGDQKPIYALEGWADSGLLVSIPLGERQIGGRPEDPLPAAWLNLIGAYAAMVDRLTVDLSSPDDIGLIAPGLALREQGGSANRGAVLAFADGVRLSVGTQSTQRIEANARVEMAQSSGQALCIGGVSYGYGAGGSECRWIVSAADGIPGGTATVSVSLRCTLTGPGQRFFAPVPISGYDRGPTLPSGSRTPAGFYSIPPNSVRVAAAVVGVPTTPVDMTVSLQRIERDGTTTTVATDTIAITGSLAEYLVNFGASALALDVTDGARHVIEVAVTDSTPAEVQIATVSGVMTKRGVE